MGLVCTSCKCTGQGQNRGETPAIFENESSIDLPKSVLRERLRHTVQDELVNERIRNAKKDSVRLSQLSSFEEMTIDAVLIQMGKPDLMLEYGDTVNLEYGESTYEFVRDTLFAIIVD